MKELKAALPKSKQKSAKRKQELPSFECNVTAGRELLAMSQDVDGWEKRDCYFQLKSAYIKVRRSDTTAMVNRDVKKLFDVRYKYVFLDEVTLMKDFIDSAALFSDVFATMGMQRAKSNALILHQTGKRFLIFWTFILGIFQFLQLTNWNWGNKKCNFGNIKLRTVIIWLNYFIRQSIA